jgi:predicted tellurium resistance membrane protein TerC
MDAERQRSLLSLFSVEVQRVDLLQRVPHPQPAGRLSPQPTASKPKCALYVEFFAGYITEYSLSVDNLFVFLVIMGAFKVPAIHKHKVLLIGILLALAMRRIFIFLGAAVITEFSWVFFLFGAFLIYTAYTFLKQNHTDEEELSASSSCDQLNGWSTGST